ncbi:unnamed protein product, partial [Acanthoscelides obtectus]
QFNVYTRVPEREQEKDIARQWTDKVGALVSRPTQKDAELAWAALFLPEYSLADDSSLSPILLGFLNEEWIQVLNKICLCLDIILIFIGEKKEERRVDTTIEQTLSVPRYNSNLYRKNNRAVSKKKESYERLILTCSKDLQALVRGEPNYQSDVTNAKGIWKRAKKISLMSRENGCINNVKIIPEKLKNVDELLTKHFGSAWKQKSEEFELEYYTAVMDNQQSLIQAEENADEGSSLQLCLKDDIKSFSPNKTNLFPLQGLIKERLVKIEQDIGL